MEKKINFCITDSCFLKCPGCYNKFSYKQDLNKYQIIKFLKYVKLHGIHKITFSGGDPLTRNDITQIIKKSLKLGFTINLDTLGTPFIKNCKTINLGINKKIKQIKNFNIFKHLLVGIPFDGSTNEIIYKFRQGRKNLLNEQNKILKTLEKHNIKVCINTVLHKNNINDLSNIYNTISKYNNIVKWQIFQFMPLGERAFNNSSNYFISNKEYILTHTHKLTILA